MFRFGAYQAVLISLLWMFFEVSHPLDLPTTARQNFPNCISDANANQKANEQISQLFTPAIDRLTGVIPALLKRANMS